MNCRLSLIAALVAIVPSLAGSIAAAQDVLRPEAAFPYTLEASEDQITLAFQVPEGYYLYRQRFGFESLTDGVVLGAADFPQGKMYEDEFFGVMETYREEFEIRIPYQRSANVEEMEFRLMLQGCADIGLCYPPQRWDSTLALPPGAADGGSVLSTFLTGSTGNDEVLPPDEAFVMDTRIDSSNEITVSWIIQPGYYLYRDKFDFSVDGPIQLGTPRLPDGENTEDEYFGEVEVYYDYVEAQLPFSRASPDAVDVELTVLYQGCKVDSICYPVMEGTRELGLPATSTFTASAPTAVHPPRPGKGRVVPD